MVADAAAAAEVLYKQSLSVQYQLCVTQSTEFEIGASSTIFSDPRTSIESTDSSVTVEISRSESL